MIIFIFVVSCKSARIQAGRASYSFSVALLASSDRSGTMIASYRFGEGTAMSQIPSSPCRMAFAIDARLAILS